MSAHQEPRDTGFSAKIKETLREEVLTDLRVFELNSDSGKSTPSNNGKKGKSRPKPREHAGAGQVRVATSQGRLVSCPCEDPRRDGLRL